MYKARIVLHPCNKYKPMVFVLCSNLIKIISLSLTMIHLLAAISIREDKRIVAFCFTKITIVNIIIINAKSGHNFFVHYYICCSAK